MEVAADEFGDLLRMEGYVVAERAVIETSELRDDSVDHSLGEDAVFLKDYTLLLQAVGRSRTAVGQRLQFCQFLLIGLVMDVHGHIGAVGHFQSIRHLQSVEQTYADTCKHLIRISRTVGRPDLKGLLATRVIVALWLLGIGFVTHIHARGPAERHTYEHRAVAVAPTNIRRCLLMGNEPEIRGRILVAEGRQRRSHVEQPGDCLACRVTQPSVLHEHILVILAQLYMEV